VKKTLLLSLSIVALCTAVLAFPAAAGASDTYDIRVAPARSDRLMSSIPGDAQALQLVTLEEMASVRDTAAKKVKLYLKIYEWDCIDYRVDIWINNTYLGYAGSGPGTYYLGSFKRGAKYQLYCRDNDGWPSWKSKRTYINSNTFTWSIYCP